MHMSTKEIRVCDRKLVARFLKNQLEDEDRLDFLFHLDQCPSCWEEVYNATKALHPHYYKSSARKVKISEKELKKLSQENGEEEEMCEIAS